MPAHLRICARNSGIAVEKQRKASQKNDLPFLLVKETKDIYPLSTSDYL